mmetsp:Transcript_20449/g.62322  ORF Transcript_20449/g.62322 Transcript_20449/m.62322 type:complete len:201 (+) Transcript_20449:282-884(+)
MSACRGPCPLAGHDVDTATALSHNRKVEHTGSRHGKIWRPAANFSVHDGVRVRSSFMQPPAPSQFATINSDGRALPKLIEEFLQLPHALGLIALRLFDRPLISSAATPREWLVVHRRLVADFGLTLPPIEFYVRHGARPGLSLVRHRRLSVYNVTLARREFDAPGIVGGDVTTRRLSCAGSHCGCHHLRRILGISRPGRD